MVAVGLVLLVLCVLLAVGVVLSAGESVDADVFGVSLDRFSIGGLFLVGLIVGVIATIGLGLMLVGAARRRAKRAAAKREVRHVRDERESLAEENARLQAELQRTAAAPPLAPAGSTAQGGTGYEGTDYRGTLPAGTTAESAEPAYGTGPADTALAGEGAERGHNSGDKSSQRGDDDVDPTGRHRA